MARPRFQFSLRTCFAALTVMAAIFTVARHVPADTTMLLMVASMAVVLWAMFVNRFVSSLTTDAPRRGRDLDR